MISGDFVKYHLREALRTAALEVDGDEDLARCLHPQTKLQLINISEELRELAKSTSYLPERLVEVAYNQHKQKAEELRA